MSQTDLSWSVPVMRAGYAGRGLVYLVVAGFSLYAIWRGGSAEGTQSALQQLETTFGGGVVLFLIFAGLMAYMIWRLIDAAYDLEAYGSDGEGAVARIGMVVTGLIHGALGIAALLILFASGGSSGGGSGGGGSTIAEVTGQVMSQPYGRWIVGLAGLATVGAGLYYIKKAWKEEYRKFLRANHFTVNWNWALKAGVAAQGVVVTIVGGFLLVAAWRANPNEAGGLGQTFSWLQQQTYGQILVTLLCLGLLGFSLFCFVNAGYRIIPKVAGDDIETLGQRLKAKAEQKASA
ncbi:DUF1206 domain-containing protein [Histidinibacterium aquaticum]|uniref:DUF1206 domain-containing protein n=1 Tax=Histidinibacterium aquaticum TaxID=2613962 RepID=A0A5J5GM71_9RHOB|nr:DUF1206 domain-containing protein [Histidinibacterium aquaticum]KAA9008718.1 DUF1206 domain-containing protein [Histidinibacterium aquaticum]